MTIRPRHASQTVRRGKWLYDRLVSSQWQSSASTMTLGTRLQPRTGSWSPTKRHTLTRMASRTRLVPLRSRRAYGLDRLPRLRHCDRSPRMGSDQVESASSGFRTAMHSFEIPIPRNGKAGLSCDRPRSYLRARVLLGCDRPAFCLRSFRSGLPTASAIGRRNGDAFRRGEQRPV